jgi:hypothetical protein
LSVGKRHPEVGVQRRDAHGEPWVIQERADALPGELLSDGGIQLVALDAAGAERRSHARQ